MRTLVLLLLGAGGAFAQCAGCPTTFGDYKGQVYGQLDVIQSRPLTATSPQPDMPWVGEIWDFSNGYLDALNRLGVKKLEVQFPIQAAACIPEYVPGPTGLCTPTNQTIYNGIVAGITHLVANGQTIGFGWFPTNADIAALGLTSSSTEADLEAATKNLLVAIATHWPGHDLQIMEEPTTLGLVLSPGAACSPNCTQFSVGDIHTYLVNVSAAIKAADPTTKVGAAAAGIAGTQNGGPDYAYFTDWGNFTPGTTLDFLGLDIFQSTCVVSNFNSDMAQYASMISGVQIAARGGWTIHATQTGPPRYCWGTGVNASGDANTKVGQVYLGMADLWYQWMTTVQRWGPANGITQWNLFCPEVVWYFATDTTKKCHSGTYQADSVAHESETTAAGFGLLQRTVSTSVQGTASVTGTAKIGQ